ncbi:MAG: transglutaminase-like domain-containing protein [Thermoplasmatota archaeon]
MTPKKAKKLRIEEDEEWDEWEEEEVDDIIDDEDDEEDADISDETAKPAKIRSPPIGRPRKRTGGKPMNPKAKKGIVWTARIIVVGLVVLLLFAPWPPFHEIREASGINSLKNLMRPYLPFPEWTNVSVTLVYDVVISGGRANEIEIHVAPPFDIPFEPQEPGDTKDFVIQDVRSIDFSPENHIPLQDFQTTKNTISGWKVSNVIGELRYEVTLEMTLHAYKWDLEEEDSGTVDDIPQQYKDRYNVNAWPVDLNGDGDIEHYRYEPDDQLINRTAHTLTKDEPTVLGKVKAIYDWMQDRFNYTSQEERQRDRLVYGEYPKWATGCLADWYGDCDDQSLLMASLCRAVGIPAWLEIGYLYDPNPLNNDNTKKWGGHGWFNVLIPLAGTNDYVIANIDPVNHEFLFRDPYRFTDWVDDGTYMDINGKRVYNLDYYYNYFSSQTPPGVDVDPNPSTVSNRFERHGSIKVYTDRPFTEGNLPGTQQELASLPSPSPLLLAPLLMIFIALPVRRYFLKRE